VQFRIALRLVLAATLTACGDASSKVTSPPPPPPPPTNAQTAETCRVTLIADGDTFDCAGVGRVRFIGMDAPEMGQIPFGTQARTELLRLLPIGTTVRLQRDITERDVYGRRLAYVWQGTVLMNELMVQRGYALTAIYPPDTAMLPVIRAAELQARTTVSGLWATGGFDCTPRDWRADRC
jgi:micrococcal nuclease